jgi:hypothetical protein
MAIVYRVTNAPNTGSSLIKNTTLTYAEGDGNFAVLENLSSSYVAFIRSYNTGSFTGSFTGSLLGTASYAKYAETSSYATDFTVANTLTAQTIIVQVITSSVDYVTGSTRFGSLIGNTHIFTGSVSISGSITGTNGVVNNLTASWAISSSYANNAISTISASYALNSTSASYSNNSTSASYALNASNATSASYAANTISASYALNASNASSASYALNASNASFATNATSASYSVSSSYSKYAETSSHATSFNVANNLTVGGTITSGGTAVVLGSGTTNTVPKFTAASTLGNSLMIDNGSTILVNGASDSGFGAMAINVRTGGGGANLILNTNGTSTGIVFTNTAASSKLWGISTPVGSIGDLAIDESGVGPAPRLYFKAGGAGGPWNTGVNMVTPTETWDVSGSIKASDILVITPQSPLPSGRPTGSFAVSGSDSDCKPYFYNGSTWTALF